MNTRTLIVALIAVAAVGAVFASYFQINKTEPEGGWVCTMDAKLCPDGSYVGRTGPNCEFAACPGTGVTPGVPVVLTARIGQEVSGLDVKIIPTKILEDSRCPIDVTCIQAGTVRVQARLISGLGEALQEFKLGQPITTEAEIVTLTRVSPAPESSVQIRSADYVFTFEVAKRTNIGVGGGILPYNSGIRGTVLLGPTCPVVQEPPDPRCADKPYATTITVRRQGSVSTFATAKSGASGTFEFSLPPGAYTLTADGGATFPRCSDKNVTVSPDDYITLILSCDTGIR